MREREKRKERYERGGDEERERVGGNLEYDLKYGVYLEASLEPCGLTQPIHC
jgi:hypothetical protein